MVLNIRANAHTHTFRVPQAKITTNSVVSNMLSVSVIGSRFVHLHFDSAPIEFCFFFVSLKAVLSPW